MHNNYLHNTYNMKDRIRKVMEYAGLSQQDFAARCGISPSSLSGIFNGRTEPSKKHVAGVHEAFPEVSVGWLMFGEGEMFSGDKSAPKDTLQGTLFDGVQGTVQAVPGGTSAPQTAVSSASVSPTATPSPVEGAYYGQPLARDFPEPKSVLRETAINLDKKTRRIKEIRVFFDDGTFETFTPSAK